MGGGADADARGAGKCILGWVRELVAYLVLTESDSSTASYQSPIGGEACCECDAAHCLLGKELESPGDGPDCANLNAQAGPEVKTNKERVIRRQPQK